MNFRIGSTLFCVLLTLAGCARIKFQTYTEFVAELDGKSELSITTFPAFFPREENHIPFIFREFISHEKLYFQVFIRDKVRKSGSNPHVQSIEIHSFSYQLNDQEGIELISDLKSNFWKQGQRLQKNTNPVLFQPDSTVKVWISLTLNGQKFTKSGLMRPKIQTQIYPLIIYSLS